MSTGQEPPAIGQDLSLEEVAAKLGCSRPYVVMLCDKGKLGEIVLTSDGHPRVRAPAVDAYLAQRTAENLGASDYVQVARDLGMYEVPEVHCIGFGRPTTDERSGKD